MDDLGGPAPWGAWRCELRLLGGFQLRCGGRNIDTMPSLERVLAFLALRNRPLPRAYVAASLWPETSDGKACANLRTTLWRLNEPDHDVFETNGSHLALRADVWVDVRAVEAAARRYRATGAIPGQDFVDDVRGELLPGLWDSWLVFERERLRQEIVNLYEVISRDALRRGDGHLAVLAALAAVEGDTVRETSIACLIEAHLSLGNRSDAVREFRRYRAVLLDEVGVEPGLDLASLVGEAVSTGSPG